MDEHDMIEWVDGHRTELRDISARYQSDDRVVRGLALMVLTGYTDEEVMADLAHEIVVFDGQRSPLRGVPDILGAIRELVTAS